MVHCYYRDLGGENLSFEAETRLLRSAGVEVATYTRDNRELDNANAVGRSLAGLTTTWSIDAYRSIRDRIRHTRPDVVHVQNTFPLISPAAVHAAHRAGVPVVQALRNYRMLCTRATLFRDAAICRDCVGRALPLPAIQHGCYHGSRIKATAVAFGQVTHRLLGTWHDAVDLFVAPSQFARGMFVDSGLDPTRVVVKPNFVEPDPGVSGSTGSYAVFAGRLAREKGIGTMLEAWRRPGLPPLRIVGDGPLRAFAEDFIATHQLEDRVELLGYRPPGEVMSLMREARFLVFPSEWYETFGRSAAEAFACGVPVVASRLGALEEVVEDGVNGRLFGPGDPDALADAARDVTRAENEAGMRRAARETFERRYTGSINLELLLDIYRKAGAAALERRARPSRA
jgi:glycosyltransferase involved in cell wall biosynthesis